jgi:hypothetical protein
MSVKDDVQKMIDKRARSITQARNVSRDKPYKQTVLEFLEKMEQIRLQYCNNKDAFFYKVEIDNACTMLIARLRTFDPTVGACIMWSNEEDPTKIQALGIKIFWSKSYAVLTKIDQEEFIDVTSLLLLD